MIYHIRSAENVGVFENHVTVVLSTKKVGHEHMNCFTKSSNMIPTIKLPRARPNIAVFGLKT